MEIIRFGDLIMRKVLQLLCSFMVICSSSVFANDLNILVKNNTNHPVSARAQVLTLGGHQPPVYLVTSLFNYETNTVTIQKSQTHEFNLKQGTLLQATGHKGYCYLEVFPNTSEESIHYYAIQFESMVQDEIASNITISIDSNENIQVQGDVTEYKVLTGDDASSILEYTEKK